MMNAVFYDTGRGESKRIAEYCSSKLGFPLLDVQELENRRYGHTVLVFPVYCQNVPTLVKSFLSKLNTEYLTVIATYGKMSFGNVLWEIQNRYPHTVIAGAYLPTKHTYLDEKRFDDWELLDGLFIKINAPNEVKIPRSFKNPLANVVPELRSRLGVRLIKTSACNACKECEKACRYKAIREGKPNKTCVRCLRCVEACPQQALRFQCRLPLKLYLKKKKNNRFVLYV